MTNLEIIEHCLDQLSPSSLEYDQWLQIGAAIKYEGGTVQLWDQWSSADPRYRNNDCSRRWNGLNKGMSPVTVATVIKLCKDAGGQVPRMEYSSSPDDNAPIPMEGSVFFAPKRKDEQIIRKEWLEIEALPEDDGSRTGSQELIEYLRALFQRDEYVGYVATAFLSEPNKEGVQTWLPGGKGIYETTAGKLISALSQNTDPGWVIGDPEPDAGAWIRFNPLDGKGVSDSNVTDYRFALVESDDVPINEQWSIYRKLELPIAALVHSGGKSLHAIVRIEAIDYKEYQKRVDALYEICRKNGLSIDRKNRNPSRLSRMPGVLRHGVRQRLVATNIGKGSWNEWIDWVQAQNDDLPEVETLSGIWDDLPELAPCLIDGVLRKGHKMLVSGPSKAGKSFLLLELVAAIAEGQEWLFWKCQQGRVLYVNLELDRASCLHRLKDIYTEMGIKHPHISNIDVWNLRGKSLPMDDLAPRLIRRAAKRSYAAVIIDPIYKVITGDENSADQMAKFCNQFDKVCNELKCSVIYCHHHSKGDQGQKRAQDRASGSGVFARDPDALIDMVELDIDEARRKEIKYKFQVRQLQNLLDKIAPEWKTDVDLEDAERLEYLIGKARKVSPDADRINAAEIARCEAMTGWRIGGILREFPSFPDRHAFFRHPLHITGPDTETLLQDCRAEGEQPLRKPLTPAERAQIGKEQAQKRHDAAVNETRIAFDALNDGMPVTTKRLAHYMDITERRALERLKAAGYKQMEGVKGVWVEETTPTGP